MNIESGEVNRQLVSHSELGPTADVSLSKYVSTCRLPMIHNGKDEAPLRIPFQCSNGSGPRLPNADEYDISTS